MDIQARHHTNTADFCGVRWIADLLPNEMAPAITGMIEQRLAAMKRTLES